MDRNFEEWLDKNNLQHAPHQKIAVEWCLQREKAETGPKGGINADEMGLGKTIEMLGTIYSNPLPHTLIVLPYSLLEQWRNIITTLFHHEPLIYHGPKRKRLTREQVLQHPIVVTTYGLLNERYPDPEEPEEEELSLLYTIQWNRIVYDEAHHLRNKKTSVHLGALRLRTEITWLMTGTPIQNSEQDLYNLFAILGFNSQASLKANITTLIAEYILRRTKEEAGLKLPACHSAIVSVPWKYTKEQNLAKKIHSKLAFSQLTQNDILSGPDGYLTDLANAKKICVLPSLFKNTTKKKFRFILDESDPTIKADPAIKADPTIKADPAIHSIKKQELCNHSSKLDSVIKTILARKNNGKPKLVFCYFHKEIDTLYEVFIHQAMNVKKFDGRTSKKDRTQILLEPCEVLIGQIEATNEGLNLQAYKEIYIVSPHWNPAVEDQAIARCHRLGQTEEVTVFHFLMTGFTNEEADAITLDQHICNIQEKKRDIIQTFLGNTF